MIGVAVDGTCSRYQGHTFGMALVAIFKEMGIGAKYNPRAKRGIKCILAIGVKSLHQGLFKFNVPIFVYNNLETYLTLPKDIDGWIGAAQERGFWPKHIRGVVNYSPYDRDSIMSTGIKNFTVAPLGYHELFDFSGEYLRGRGIDVSFLGTISEVARRFKIIREVQKKCGEVEVIGWQNRSYGVRFSHNPEKILQSKVWLHVHRMVIGDNFPCHRILQLGLSNERFVITEPCRHYPEGLIHGKHLVVAEKGKLVETILEYLGKPEERSKIAKAGHEWIQKDFKLIDNWRPAVKEMLSWI